MRLSSNELLAELGWLRRLARSLVGGVGAEEDLVQETWLAASQVDGGVSRKWLVTTLRNLAAGMQRRESRLRKREGAVARPELVDSDSLVERNELFSIVLGELRELEQPYRTVLLLIYQEGLSVRDVAERLEIAPDTLRWQHREGLARIRQALDRKSPPKRDWRAAFLPLLSLPSKELLTGASALSASTKIATLLGGLFMTWKLTTAAVVAGLAVLLAIWGGGEPGGLPVLLEPALEKVQIDAADSMVLAEPQSEEPLRLAAEIEAPVVQGLAASPAITTGLTLTVTVIDGRRNLVGGARVWEGDSPDPVDAFWITNEKGVAVIPRGEGVVATVSSSAPGLFGSANYFVKHGGGETVVLLSPDADVQVQIVDEKGHAVEGVPVSLGGRYRASTSVKTDAAGNAALRHVLDVFKFNQKGREFTVGPAILLRPSAHVSVARDSVPSEAIRIVLPPTGSLFVRVLDAQGNPNVAAKEVKIFIDPAPGTDRDVPQLMETAKVSKSMTLTLSVKDGAAHIPFLGLGLRLMAQAKDAEATESTFGFAAGPQVAGERTELVLRPLDKAPELVGIALDGNGNVLANRTLTGTIRLFGGMKWENSDFEVLTDAGGHFRIVVEKALSKMWVALEERTIDIMSVGASSMERGFYSAELPDRIQSGGNDIGAIFLPADLPFLRGHAIDQDGNPIQIRAAELVVRSDDDKSLFRILHSDRLTIDESAFGFFGESLALNPNGSEYYLLSLTAEDHPSIAARVQLGLEDQEFVFSEGGAVKGTVVLEKGDSPQNYMVYFYTTDKLGKRSNKGFAQLYLNGSFEMPNLPLATGEVEIRAFRSEKVLALIPGILPGSDSAEQRALLDNIDIRPVLLDYSLKVTDEQGSEIATAYFDSPDVPYSARGDEYYSLHWSVDAQSLSGVLTAPGYRSVELVLLPGERSVVMTPGPEVFVHVSPLPNLPQDAIFSVLLVAVETDEEVLLIPIGGGDFAGFVAGSGEYRIRGRVTQRGVVVTELPFSVDPYASVEVAESTPRQKFEVPIDVQAFEDSISVE